MGKKLTKPSEGFLLAKRSIVEKMDIRLDYLENRIIYLKETDSDADVIDRLEIRIFELERMRSFIKNGILWNTQDGE